MDLHPDFPVVDGEYRLTPAWVVTLPEAMNKRVEDGKLVFWGHGFSAIVSLWGPKEGQGAKQRLAWLKESASRAAYDRREAVHGGTTHFTYRLKEAGDDKHMPAYYCYAVGAHEGHVQIAMYFDGEEDAAKARALCDGTIEKRGKMPAVTE